MTLSAEAIGDAAAALSRGRRFWLTTHVKSDGDGIGCELALARALRAMGREVRVINDTKVPCSLKFLLSGDDEIAVYEPGADDGFLAGADTIVVLDVGVVCRLGRLEEAFRSSGAVKVCLDHHRECGSGFDHVLSDVSIGSTGEILFPLLEAMGWTWTRDTATPLFAAISIDTGSFAYERCTPQTFRMAGALVEAGAEPYAIHKHLHWHRRLDEIQLEGEVFRSLRIEASGAVAYSEISRHMLDRFKVDPMELPTVVNIPLAVEGVEVALLFVESDPCHVNVSARSKGRFGVNALAKRFGGGGHPLAAGFCLDGPLEEVKAKVLREARELLGMRSVCASP